MSAISCADGRCQACMSLQEVCLRKGAENHFWKMLQDEEHYSPDAETFGVQLSSEDKQIAQMLHPLVHAVALHQHRLTEEWYNTWQKKLSQLLDLESADSSCAVAALVEVICVTSFAIALSRFILGVGKELDFAVLVKNAPSPSKASPSRTSPMELWKKLRKKTEGWASYVTSADVRKDLPPEKQKELKACTLQTDGPGASPAILPKEAQFLNNVLFETMYVDLKGLTSPSHAGPNRSLRRYQLEACAVATVRELHCFF
mmetsp:Transcript_3701/g.5858  ORF Transcript_3701/g.5858 Transcript_3701/m.5858 type:complete len:259 (-) Transcript_3701:765-1541(-)